jgi:hypothetical protein
MMAGGRVVVLSARRGTIFIPTLLRGQHHR